MKRRLPECLTLRLRTIRELASLVILSGIIVWAVEPRLNRNPFVIGAKPAKAPAPGMAIRPIVARQKTLTLLPRETWTTPEHGYNINVARALAKIDPKMVHNTPEGIDDRFVHAAPEGIDPGMLIPAERPPFTTAPR